MSSSTPVITAVEQLMADYVEQQKTAGMVTLVSQSGNLIHQQAHGFQDIASQAPMSPDTIFRIYSMTKAITSVALMTLFEQGRFQLDDPARRWIPALKTLKVYRNEGAYDDLESDITIRQLLTHTAGFSYGFDPDNEPVDQLYGELWNTLKKDKPLTELMDIAFGLPLIAQPGSRWHYSIATDICGYLVELMSDMPFGDYLQQTIFDPLNMFDTAFEVPEHKRHRFATLYGLKEGEPLAVLETSKDSPFIPAANMEKVRLQSGGGGLVSTITDYWQFAQMMLNRGELNGVRIIKPETVDNMTRNHVAEELQPLSFNGIFPEPVEGYGFGLGYCINMTESHFGSVGDFGWGGMADTYCWIDPKKRIVGILMQQFMPSLTY
ncbi:MAG: beta-lactamase family protein, partial [Gammaproteobacteria bacterium]|nr:beta-lactamase family protein [Gammaproteobacteria bacterium]